MRNAREDAARLFNREEFDAANPFDNDEDRDEAWINHIINVFGELMMDPPRQAGPRSHSSATSMSIPSSVSISRAISSSSSSSIDNFPLSLEQKRKGELSSRSSSMDDFPLVLREKEGKRIDVVKPLGRFRENPKDQETGEPSCIFCAICRDASPVKLMTAPVPCTHRCCVECFRNYLAHQLQQVPSLLIKCPQTYCTLMHPPTYWSQYIPQRVSQRKELALLESKRIEQIGTGRRAAFLHFTSWC